MFYRSDLIKSTGLILEGGGLRGVYTAGVLDCFLENEIELRDCFAVSAGACHACSYLSHQHGRAFATAVDHLKNPNYCSFYSLIRTGDLFNARFNYHEIPESIYPIDNIEFKRTTSNFRAVITNCLTGEAEYPRVTDMFRDIDLVRASSSMPGVSRLVRINGTPYLDGGIADAIPLRRAEREGYKKNVVVLTRDRTYRKGTTSLTRYFRLKYRAYPNLILKLEMRHLVYNASLEHVRQSENDGSAFVIAPSVPLELGRMEKDREKITAIYSLGKSDAEAHLPELREFLRD